MLHRITCRYHFLRQVQLTGRYQRLLLLLFSHLLYRFRLNLLRFVDLGEAFVDHFGQLAGVTDETLTLVNHSLHASAFRGSLAFEGAQLDRLELAFDGVIVPSCGRTSNYAVHGADIMPLLLVHHH